MSDKNQEPKLVEVTLSKRHTHAGTDYKSGDKIKVTEPDRAWLVLNKVIHHTPKAQEGAK